MIIANHISWKNKGINWSSYWTRVNFSPDSTGAENLAALNTALTNYRHVKIVTPGVYDFNNTIWIPSNTTLEVCAGVTFRKETGSVYSHIIGNKGILTNTANTNIKVYGNGLNLDINGIDTFSLTDTAKNPILRLRSVFEFYKVSDFIIDDIYADNMDMVDQFFMSFSACTDGDVSNIDQTSEKNSINILGGCKRLNFTNIVMNGTDDAFFVGIGYPNCCVTYGDVEDIVIDGATISCPGVPAGYVSRLWGGSWEVWTNGRTYHDQESCVGSNGVIYARGWNTGGDKVASVEPTHININEHPTGADGIEWWIMEGATAYKVDVKNITFKDVELTALRTFFEIGNNYVTPGTENDSIIDNLICDNISIPANYDKYIISQTGYLGEFTIKNSTLNTWATGVSRGILSHPSTSVSKTTKLAVDNCTIILPTNVSFIYNNSDGGVVSELEILNSNINLLQLFVKNEGIGTVFGKLVITDSTITATGIKPIVYGLGQLEGDNTIFTRTKFIGIERLVYLNVSANPVALTQRYTDCEFETLLSYIVVCTTPNYNIDIIMSGTKFIDPASYLFYNNQGIGDVDINISGSSGAVTPAKVRNGVKVTVTACDLAYV